MSETQNDFEVSSWWLIHISEYKNSYNKGQLWPWYLFIDRKLCMANHGSVFIFMKKRRTSIGISVPNYSASAPGSYIDSQFWWSKLILDVEWISTVGF